jgi:GntR family transcriptional regulator/MocR family aminotransferase
MPIDNRLRVCTPDGREFDFLLDSDAGAAALGQFLLDYMPKRLAAPPRLLRAPGHQFTDKAEKFVSLINLASVRALEARWGQALDPLRFRANIYIDGAEPFVELDWVGRKIRLGTVIAEVAQRNGRCAATNVNPATGVRDRDVPGRLRAEFGHKDLGVYLKIGEGGNLRAGNVVSVEPAISRPEPVARSDSDSAGRLICSACYFLLEPGVHDLPQDYRCPDCGAGPEAVLPAHARHPKI